MRSTLPAALLVTLAVSSTAVAAKPEVVRIDDEIDQVLETCEGFDVLERARVTGRVTTRFDKAGVATRVTTRLRFRGVFVNSATGAVLSPDRASFKVTMDAERGTTVITGVRFKFKLPDGGGVILDAGRIVFDETGAVVKVSGRHDLLDGASVCEALGAGAADEEGADAATSSAGDAEDA